MILLVQPLPIEIPGPPQNIQNEKLVKAIQNSQRSMRKTARELEISKSSMHKMFKDDLGLMVFKKQ